MFEMARQSTPAPNFSILFKTYRTLQHNLEVGQVTFIDPSSIDNTTFPPKLNVAPTGTPLPPFYLLPLQPPEIRW